MSKLEDMEELILKVKNKNFKPTLQEIISCYYAGAYRACIVLSFNILVDDLVEKIKHLKDTNSELREIYSEILKKNKESTPIENYLVESLLSKNLIDNLDGELYTIFQKLRHKSAHPTGFSPSAECARYVFSEVVNRFLSKDGLKTTSRIDELIDSLQEGHFYSGYSIKEIAGTVSKEIEDISPTAFPQLVNRIYKNYTNLDDKPNNPYLRFILGMAYLNKDELSNILINVVIKTKSQQSDNKILFISLLSTNPNLFESIDAIVASRVYLKVKELLKDEKIIKQKLNSLSHPFLALVKVLNFTNSELSSIINDDIDVVFESPQLLTFFLSKIDMKNQSFGRVSYENVYKKMITKIKEKDISIIIESIENDDSGAYRRMSGDKLHLIVTRIIKSYEGDDEKISEFLTMLRINHIDIVSKINEYTNSSEIDMNKIRNKCKNISDEIFSIMEYVLGVQYPS